MGAFSRADTPMVVYQDISILGQEGAQIVDRSLSLVFLMISVAEYLTHMVEESGVHAYVWSTIGVRSNWQLSTTIEMALGSSSRNKCRQPIYHSLSGD
jgi:hypothetical protein